MICIKYCVMLYVLVTLMLKIIARNHMFSLKKLHELVSICNPILEIYMKYSFLRHDYIE